MNQEHGRFGHVSKLRSLLDQGGWWHSFELPDGQVIRGANSLSGLRERLANFPVAEDLRGKRVLDIGSWDGWFAFEMERRGAEVMAVDVFDNPRFREIHRIYESRIDYRQIDVYDLDPDKVGRFDIVLFMGVLYHLKHPLLGLERVCALCKELAVVDSFVLQTSNANGATLDRPLMEFFETDEFGGQVDNWVAPNVPCLLALCRTAGFARAELRNVGEFGASVACFRQWASGERAQEQPELVYLAHHTNFGINFESKRDQYVTAWFDWRGGELQREDVRPTVGLYGIAPVMLKRRTDIQWETSFRIPPGLTSGWHDIRVQVGKSAPSNSMRIAVDVVLEVGHITVRGVRDGNDWTPDRLDRDKGDVLSLWLVGLPDNTDCHNLRVLVDGDLVKILYIGYPDAEDRQINCQIPEGVPIGWHSVTVQIETASASASFEVV